MNHYCKVCRDCTEFSGVGMGMMCCLSCGTMYSAAIILKLPQPKTVFTEEEYREQVLCTKTTSTILWTAIETINTGDYIGVASAKDLTIRRAQNTDFIIGIAHSDILKETTWKQSLL